LIQNLFEIPGRARHSVNGIRLYDEQLEEPLHDQLQIDDQIDLLLLLECYSDTFPDKERGLVLLILLELVNLLSVELEPTGCPTELKTFDVFKTEIIPTCLKLVDPLWPFQTTCQFIFTLNVLLTDVLSVYKHEHGIVFAIVSLFFLCHLLDYACPRLQLCFSCEYVADLI
jgi:hypothetical protein